MRLSLDLGLGSRWSYDNTALGNGILAWMSRTGVWQDEANGQPTLWNDGEVWDDGVSRNFTAAAIDTNGQPGDICGTIAPLPDGGAVTYTLADTFGDMFAISGATVVIGTSAVVSGVYSLTANAVNVSGWTWAVPCLVTVTEAAIVLPMASFSRQPQIGVALTDTVIEGIEEGITVTCNVPGITVDDTVRPVAASGTPTTAGTFSNGLVTGYAGDTRLSPVTVLEGAPAFTVDPVMSGTFQVGQTVTTTSGTAPGAMSFAYQLFRRNTGTGNGLAVSGAFNPTRDIPVADEGYQYRYRVRAFRGSLYGEAFTAWSTAIVAATETLPVFSGASSFSGSTLVGDTLTAVAGAGTGTASVQWTANNVAIPGATDLTYVLQWSDRNKSIKPVVTRTNRAGSVADTTVLTPIVCEPKLSSAYHGNPGWYDGSEMRYMLPIYVTPYEPGKGGTLKVAALPSTARQRTGDQRIDALFIGSEHWATPGTPIGNIISNSGFRNVLYANFDTDGYKTQHLRASGIVDFLSVGSDTFRSSDQLWFGGSVSSAQPGYQTTRIQGCRLQTLGSYANYWLVPNKPESGINEYEITSVQRTGTNTVVITIDLSSAPASYTYTEGGVTKTANARPPVVIDPTTGKAGYVILYDVEVSPGVVDGLNETWNTNYDITSYSAVGSVGTITAKMAMDPSDFTPTVGASAVAGTGKCVVLIKKADNHSDGGQKNEGEAGPTFRHCNTYYGNYTVWGIEGNYASSRNDITLSCENIRRLLTFDPQEWTAQLIYFQLSAGSTFAYQLTQVYINALWAKISLKNLVLPVRDDPVTLTKGPQFLPMGTDLYPDAIGGVELDDVTDYVPAGTDFWNIARTFTGQRNPTNADLTGISLTPTAWSAGAPVGSEVGQLILGHLLPDGLNDASGRPVIVDLTISGANAGKVSQGWSGLLYTTASTGGSSFTIDVTATVRDSAANYGAAVTHGPVTITVTPV